MDTQTTQTTKQDSDLLMAEHLAEYSRRKLIEDCLAAVKTLEDFAAKARREVAQIEERKPSELVSLPGQILAHSAWGAANASSQLNNAMRTVAEYMRALGESDALKGGAR
ncbi:MAG TPA: hypothetical protein VHC69_27970 [Polyangiaceae bacterium]|nr:hypothetical protein [Polyangiaceae bacterium]